MAACDNILKWETQKNGTEAKAAKGQNTDNNKVNLAGLDDNKDQKKSDLAQNKPAPKHSNSDDAE